MLKTDQDTADYYIVKSKFFQGLGFELRTLLNGLEGPLQLLKKRVNDPGLVDVFRLLDTSLSRIERLSISSTIVSSLNTKIFSINKTELNIADIVRYSILELQSISSLENIKIRVPTEQIAINVFADYNMIKQVFDIMLETTISLSEENSFIDINFEDDEICTKCIITSNTATLPEELSLNIKQMGESDDIQTNLLVVKQLLKLNNADIRAINDINQQANTIEITFTKD